MRCEGCERRKQIARAALLRAAMGIKKALGLASDDEKTDGAPAQQKGKKQEAK